MRSALLAVLAAALLAPAPASGQGTPFQPLPQAPPSQPETVVVPPGSQDEGISGLQQAFLILAGVLLVVGIGFAIARDAKHNAPSETRPGPGGRIAAEGEGLTGEGLTGERRRPDPRAVKKQKAAAKRARQARKKNRPVRK